MIKPNQIEWAPALNGIAVQYSMNGFVAPDQAQFTKGLLMVVPASQWPDGVDERIVMSAKDIKADTRYASLDDKQGLQDGKIEPFQGGVRNVELHGVLGAKEQRCWNLIGTPAWLIKRLAGDYDGDRVTLTPLPEGRLPEFAKMLETVEEQANSAKAAGASIGNAKLPKTFTRDGPGHQSAPQGRDGSPDFDKTAQLVCGALVGDAATLAKRFLSLPEASLTRAARDEEISGRDLIPILTD